MSRACILVVEDHDALRELTVDALQARGHTVHGVVDGEALDECLAKWQADVVVLDVNLPGESGYDICKRLRQRSPRLGIIMLTALGAPDQRVKGYELGADIYLAKPTSQQELAAAVEGLLRRARVDSAASGGLTLEPGNGRILGPGGQESLTEAEVQMLRGLALSAQRQLETWQLLELVGSGDDEASKAALEVRIVRLRRKLVAAGATAPGIRAVRLVGYRLTDAWVVSQN